ncbi:hypothetical protein G7075_11100 [Phycicoccus sp. HDW14]|uniref:hypothetical protein n=1 Tax=Phycicoccus sp. HDW14 TaxID=2714941 RepID=UPI00140C41EF|nr:hypothetical protein [Phycicoccus sp. HDW14]QIM21549.1 hypothetical protein G7075_11100 [Phycicoccus sp. HDW14]
MGTTSTAARTLVLFMLIGGGLCVAGVLGLGLALPFAFREADRSMTIENTSGRVLLVERAADPARDSPLPVVLAVATEEWPVAGCTDERLVARDLSGSVVASRDGVCAEDTWVVTGQGLPPAPEHSAGPVRADQVEVRLTVGAVFDLSDRTLEWARALPAALERTRAAARASGATVEGPFLEAHRITFYLRGPDPAGLLDLARDDLLRPAPDEATAWGGPRRGAAPTTGPPSVLLLDPERGRGSGQRGRQPRY